MQVAKGIATVISVMRELGKIVIVMQIK